MQRKHMLFTILMIASLVLSACATASTPTAVVTEAPVVEQPTEAPVVEQPTDAPPAEKKVVTFIWTQEFDTLNPLYTNMWFVSVYYSPSMLVRHGGTMKRTTPSPTLSLKSHRQKMEASPKTGALSH